MADAPFHEAAMDIITAISGKSKQSFETLSVQQKGREYRKHRRLSWIFRNFSRQKFRSRFRGLKFSTFDKSQGRNLYICKIIPKSLDGIGNVCYSQPITVCETRPVSPEENGCSLIFRDKALFSKRSKLKNEGGFSK